MRQPKNTTKLVMEVRKAIEHRATWMYYLLKEAQNKGLDWDDFARQAITQTGAWHGQQKREKLENPASLEEFSNNFAAGTSRDVFEMEIIEQDDQHYYLNFHYCPLISAWRKLGATQEEIEHLCDIAMDGDRGIASQFPKFAFQLGRTIAQGHPVCEIRFDKKG